MMTNYEQTTPPPGSPNTVMIEEVARGQKLIIYAILIQIVGYILQLTVHPAMLVITLVAVVLAILGIVKLSKGLGKSTGMTVLFVILMFIPLISLITLLILNSEATQSLKSAGYKVGLLGASK